MGRHVTTAAAERYVVIPVEHRWQDADELVAVVERARPWACIHLGWYADPADYLTAVSPNAASLASTLDLARVLDRAGCVRMVVAGSSAEYAPAPHPLSEDDLVAPTTVYGSAKALANELLGSRCRPTVMTVAWARLFNVVGPGEDARRVVPSVARALLEGREILLSEGTQVRDYVDVRDVATALVALAGVPDGGAFNVSTGREVRLREMLEALADVTGDRSLLRFGQRPFASNENRYLVGKNDRMRAVAGWKPARDMDEMARDIMRYWEEGGGR